MAEIVFEDKSGDAVTHAELREIIAQITTLTKQVQELIDEVRSFHAAFPRTEDGNIDTEGHRRYHQNLIAAANEQALFWKQLQRDVAKKGAIGLIFIVLALSFIGAAAFVGLDGDAIRVIRGK